MRKLLTVLFTLLLSITLSAATYYVAPSGGSDSNPGTIGSPWSTWQKAFNTAQAGDIVYFRGGVYYATSAYGNNITMIDPNNGIGYDGTASNPICYYAYPADYALGNYPILDCKNVTTAGGFNTGININNAEFIKFKGLTVRNVYQKGVAVLVCGINVYNCANFTFENMKVHNLGGRAFYYESSAWSESVPYDTTSFINCDMYNLADSSGVSPGNMADGIKGHTYPKCYIQFQGCRVWNAADDGLDFSGSGIVVFDRCWVWSIGHLDVGNGSGFKIGAVGDSVSYPTRIVTNCIAAWCHNSINVGSGFGEIDYFLDVSSYYRVNARIYNNTAYKCDFGFSAGTHPNKHFRNSIYRNNVSYQSNFIQDAVRYNVLLMSYWYPESNNTWDFYDPTPSSMPPWFIETDSVTVTDADFISLDSAQLRLPRKTDGSLPSIDFLKLVSTSDLIDAGTQIPLSDNSGVILTYNGDAPDIGYSEYGTGSQIIADHTVVDKYDDIPAYYINEVKKMLFVIAGESHAGAFTGGLEAMEALNPIYNMNRNSYPDAPYSDQYLRVASTMWGDYYNATGWIGHYGEEDWFTNPTAIAQTKTGLSYCNNNGYPMSVFGFAWCYDAEAGLNSTSYDPVYGVRWYGNSIGSPEGDIEWGLDGADYSLTGNSVSMDTYLAATQSYIDYCTANNIPTEIFFTTGPVDSYTNSEIAYQAYLKWEHLRDYVYEHPITILFDYADILCYDDDGTPTTNTWNGHIYPHITATNFGTGSEAHIGTPGILRIGKALWWMFARMAGWDGISTTQTTVADVDGNDYNIISVGSQTWITKNLETTKFNNGSSIPNVTSNSSWASLTTPAYCWYNNNISNKDTYGALYNWYAISSGNLCPTGWHVTTDAEFKALEIYRGMTSGQSNATQWRGTTEGTELKDENFWLLDGAGTNNSPSVSVRPSGFRFSQDGGFYNLGYINYFWTATELNATNAYVRRFDYNKSTVYRDGNLKTGGKSVRCIKD